MDNKLNDWVLLSMENPDLTIKDFGDNGISVNNTSIYDRDRYLNSSLIQSLELFQTNGRFDPAKFNRFYDQAIKSYNDLSTYDYAKVAMDAAEFSYNNLAVPFEKRTKLPDWDIVQISNPDRRNYGIEKLGFISDPIFTPLELALNEQIWNNKTKQWEDSPNDAWLGRDWSEPVAMAVWEFDADANGNRVTNPDEAVYHKGEYKINPETGTYYYETLNGKSPYGRELLTPFDIITKDGSKANQYDFFDSDGLDKSFTGSLIKNVARIAPMFIPYVNSVYIATNIGLELGKVLPILYKSTFGLAEGDNSWANRIEGIAMSFDNNKVSKAGLDSMFNSEQILNMVADVTKQLYEQRWIFTKAPRLFKQYGIEEGGSLEKAMKVKLNDLIAKGLDDSVVARYKVLGKDLSDIIGEAFAKTNLWASKYQEEYQNIGKIMSRLYMTGTSSYQAFSDAKEEGASDLEAAAMFWGYAAGMYWLMGTDIGEHVLPELRMDKANIRRMLTSIADTGKKEAEQGIKTAIKKGTEQEEKANIFKRIFKSISDFVVNNVKESTNPLKEGFASVWSNMLAEGIEEVSEEVLYDVTRATFDTLASLSGSLTRLSQWDTALERYGQSFFGGMLGGGLFLLSNDIKIRKKFDPGNVKANEELIYYIRNGKKSQILSELNRMYKRGMLGKPDLSATLKDPSDGSVYGEGTADDNQNKAVYDLMVNYIENIDLVLSIEKMHLPDDSIFTDDQISGKEVLLEVVFRNLMANAASTGKMFLDYNSMGRRFLELHLRLDDLNAETDATKRNSEEYKFEVNQVNKLLNELRQQRDDFSSEETRAKYLGIMMFTGNSHISYPFANTSYRDYVKANYNKEPDQLSDYELKVTKEDYLDYLDNYAEKYIEQGYNRFINLLEGLSEKIQDLGVQGYDNYVESRLNFLNSKLEFTKPDNTVENLSIAQIIPLMYGFLALDDEEFLDLALNLKERYNPFDEISSMLLSNKDPNQINFGDDYLQLTGLIESLALNLNLFVLGYRYIDSKTALTVKKLIDDISKFRLNLTRYLIFDGIKGQLGTQLRTSDIDKINKVTKSFIDKVNPENYINELTQFQNNIDAIDTIEDTVKDDLKTLFEEEVLKRYSPEFTLAYNRIKSLLSNTVDSPIVKFLSELLLNSKGLNVFDIINKALDIFTTKNLSDFVVDGELSIDDIDVASQTIEEVRALIKAMLYENVGPNNPYGFTSILNQLRKKYGASELGVLNKEQAALMLLDIGQVSSKIQFIKRLHELNQESSEREQNRLLVKLNYLAYDFLNLLSPLWNNTGGRKEIEGEQILDATIETAINGASLMSLLLSEKPIDLSNEDRVKLELEIKTIETAVFNRFLLLVSKYQSSNPNIRKDLIKILFDGILPTSSSNNRDEQVDINANGITSHTLSFSVSQKIDYFVSVFGIDTLLFTDKYLRVIKADTSTMAPIPMQELCVKLGYITATNNSFTNDVLDVIKDHLTSINEFSFYIKNCVFVSGVPGAGKTKAVARALYAMLKLDDPAIKVLAVGPHKNLAENLAKAIGLTGNANILTRSELFDKLGRTSDEINDKNLLDVEYQDHEITKLEIKPQQYTGDVDALAIFIDEGSHFTALELAVLSDYCQKHGIILYIFGSPNQIGVSEILNPSNDPEDDVIINSLEACYTINSPSLTLSMRDGNTNKRDNTQQLQALTSEYTIHEFEASGKTVLELYTELPKKLSLKGTETLSGIFGEIRKEELTEDEIVTLLDNLETGEKIGYVYDDVNSNTYLLIEQLKSDSRYTDKIEILTEKQAQGQEALFYIVDLDWTIKLELTGNERSDFFTYLDFIKSLNTIVTRSKQGSYIVDRYLGLDSNIFKEIPENAVSKTSMTDTSLKNYKENRIKALEAILQGYTAPSNGSTSSNSPTPSPSGGTPSSPTGGTSSPGGTSTTTSTSGTPSNTPTGGTQPTISPSGGSSGPSGGGTPGTTGSSTNGSTTSSSTTGGSQRTGKSPANKIYQTHNYPVPNFDTHLVGLVKTDTIVKSKTSGKNVNIPEMYINKAKSFELSYGKYTQTIHPAYSKNDIDSFINTVGNNTSVYIIAVPKSEAKGATSVSEFIGNDDHINAPYIQNIINVVKTNNNLSVGSYIKYKGLLRKIVSVNLSMGEYSMISPEYAQEAKTMGVDEIDKAQRIKISEVDGHYIPSTPAEFEAEQLKYVLPESELEAIKLIEKIKPHINESNESNVFTVSKEELNNVISLATNDEQGIKVYTAFGPREGIGLEGRQEGHYTPTKNNRGEYTVNTISKGDLSVLLTPETYFQNMSGENLLLGLNATTPKYDVSINKYNEATSILDKIRSLIIYNDPLCNKKIAKLINDFRKDSTELVRETDDWHFEIKLLGPDIYKENQYGTEFYRRVRNKEALQNKTLVYTNGLFEITIGTLPSIETLGNWLADLKSKIEELKKLPSSDETKLNNIYKKWENTNGVLKLLLNQTQPSTTKRFPLPPKFKLGGNRVITNSKLTKINIHGNLYVAAKGQQLQKFDFSDYKNATSLICTDPYIVTGKNSRFDKSMNGRVVAFVTHNLLLEYWPSPTVSALTITDDNLLALLWEMAWDYDITKTPLTKEEEYFLEYVKQVREQIKPIKLDPKGYTFKDLIDSHIEFRNNLINGADAVISVGNTNTGIRLLNILLAMERDLLSEIKANNNSYVGIGNILLLNKLNLSTPEEMINFEKLLRQVLINVVERYKWKLICIEKNLNSFYNETEFNQYCTEINQFVESVFGTLRETTIFESLNSKDQENIIDKISNAFGTIFDINQKSKSMGMTKEKFNLLGTTHSYFIVDTIVNQLTKFDEGKLVLKTGVTDFISELSKLLSEYNNANGNNFIHGIYFNATYAKAPDAKARKAEKPVYLASSGAINNYTVDVVVQSPDVVINGIGYSSLIDALNPLSVTYNFEKGDFLSDNDGIIIGYIEDIDENTEEYLIFNYENAEVERISKDKAETDYIVNDDKNYLTFDEALNKLEQLFPDGKFKSDANLRLIVSKGLTFDNYYTGTDTDKQKARIIRRVADSLLLNGYLNFSVLGITREEAINYYLKEYTDDTQKKMLNGYVIPEDNEFTIDNSNNISFTLKISNATYKCTIDFDKGTVNLTEITPEPMSQSEYRTKVLEFLEKLLEDYGQIHPNWKKYINTLKDEIDNDNVSDAEIHKKIELILANTDSDILYNEIVGDSIGNC